MLSTEKFNTQWPYTQKNSQCKLTTKWQDSEPELTLETPPDTVICLYLKQLWENPTCEGRLICPEEHVSSLNKCNPIQSAD